MQIGREVFIFSATMFILNFSYFIRSRWDPYDILNYIFFFLLVITGILAIIKLYAYIYVGLVCGFLHFLVILRLSFKRIRRFNSDCCNSELCCCFILPFIIPNFLLIAYVVVIMLNDDGVIHLEWNFLFMFYFIALLIGVICITCRIHFYFSDKRFFVRRYWRNINEFLIFLLLCSLTIFPLNLYVSRLSFIVLISANILKDGVLTICLFIFMKEIYVYSQLSFFIPGQSYNRTHQRHFKFAFF